MPYGFQVAPFPTPAGVLSISALPWLKEFALLFRGSVRLCPEDLALYERLAHEFHLITRNDRPSCLEVLEFSHQFQLFGRETGKDVAKRILGVTKRDIWAKLNECLAHDVFSALRVIRVLFSATLEPHPSVALWVKAQEQIRSAFAPLSKRGVSVIVTG